MHLLYERRACEHHTGSRSRIWSNVGQMLVGWWGERLGRQRRRHSMIYLAEMEDWQLRDIGLTREDAELLLARNGIRRDPARPFHPH